MSVRQEVTGVLRGLTLRAVVSGSGVLLRLLFGALAGVVRRRIRARPAPTRPAPTPEPLAPEAGRPDADAPDVQEPDAEPSKDAAPKPQPGARRAPTGKASARKAPAGRSGADRIEQAGIAVLAVAIGIGALGGVVEAAADGVVRAVAPFAPSILGVLVVAWIIAAVLVAPPHGTEPRNDHEASGEQHTLTSEETAAARQQAAELWFVRLVLDAVHDATVKGRKGVHLATLVEGLPDGVGWDVAALRQHCDRLGIPVRKMQIRGQGKGSTWGVHVDELEAVLGAPVGDVLAALPDTPAAPLPAPAAGAPHAPAEEAAQTARPAPEQHPADTPAPGPSDAPTAAAADTPAQAPFLRVISSAAAPSSDRAA